MKARFHFKANPRLKDLKQSFAMQKPEMKTITTELDKLFRKYERRVFATEGGASGGQWQALSEEYRRWKKKKYPGRKIMQRKGKLRKGLTQKAHGDHIARSTIRPKAKVYLGSRSIVGAYHIKPKAGIRNPYYNRNMPDRDVMRQTPAQVKLYMDYIAGYITKVKLKRIRNTLAGGMSR